jgi:hypothetical protein
MIWIECIGLCCAENLFRQKDNIAHHPLVRKFKLKTKVISLNHCDLQTNYCA